MQDFPQSIMEYICTSLMDERSMGFFLIDAGGKVLRSGGMLSDFAISPPRPEDDITDILLFMKGLLPLEQSPLKLSRIRIHPGVTVDAHLFQTAEGYGLILLDAVHQEKLVARFQQKANELVLLREKHTRILEHNFGKGFAEQLLELDPHTNAVKKPATILLVSIRGVSELAEHYEPLQIFSTLREYVSTMIQSVHVEGGIVKDTFGNTIMAVFGLLPSALPPAHQSLNAVHKIFKKIADLNTNRSEHRLNALEVGMGVASCEVMAGIKSREERHSLMVVGPCFEMADRLEKLTRPGQVIVDRSTFELSGELKKCFAPVRVRLGVNTDFSLAFAWEGSND